MTVITIYDDDKQFREFRVVQQGGCNQRGTAKDYRIMDGDRVVTQLMSVSTQRDMVSLASLALERVCAASGSGDPH